MSPEQFLILIDGTDKTQSIESCEYIDGQYIVRFGISPKTYSYGGERVRYYENPIELDPVSHRLIKDGMPLYKVSRILIFGEEVRISFQNNDKLYPYKKSDLVIGTSCLTVSSAKDCMRYLTHIADLVGLTSDKGDNLLRKQYDELEYVDDKTALAKYFSPDMPMEPIMDSKPIIFPFGFNLSQKMAVNNAFQGQISIIEGPPGTGKTQTILNIIANVLLRDKTLAVVSNNNSATQNVQDKLKKYGLSFFTAFLGNSENKSVFLAEQSGTLPPMDDWAVEGENLLQTIQRVSELSKELDAKLDAQNRIAIIRQELTNIQLEYSYFTNYYNENPHIVLGSKKGFSRLNVQNILNIWLEYESFAEKERQPSFWFKLKNQLRYGMYDRAFFSRPVETIIAEFQNRFYTQQIKELEEEIVSLEKLLADFHFPDKMESFSNSSMELLKAALFQKYGKEVTRIKFAEEAFWKTSSAFIWEYPLVLSTTHSLLKSLRDVTYDYVIIDEASQVDVVTGALALSCAKNIVVVGDLKQLPNVVTDKTAKKALDIFREFALNEAYEYSSNSLLSSIGKLFPHAPRTLLREHYRCHPQIIDFCNQKFYQGELIIMTEDHGEPDTLMAYRTVEGNHASDRKNQRQIDVIINEVIPQMGGNILDEDIGIISPYRAQTDATKEQLEGTEIEVQTVHKYQGREKDNIIVTTVDNQISEFVDNPNMLNVAVSRAVKRLRVVVSGNEGNENTNIGDLVKYIGYHNFKVVDSQINSIFDLLYKQYARRRQLYLAGKKRISAYDSEDLMHVIIDRVLLQEPFMKLDVACHYPLRLLLRNMDILTQREQNYAANPLTHIDFLIFNKMDKMPVLAVEEDGYSHHKKGSPQYDRDTMKDCIMGKMEIPIMRFNTKGSKEEMRLIEMLERILNSEAFQMN